MAGTGSLTANFNAAFERLKRIPIEGPMEPGGIRYRLYGLSKQAIEGDCDAPFPQKYEVLYSFSCLL
jgi:hypothetical protein